MPALNRVQLIGNAGKKIYSFNAGEHVGVRFYLAVDNPRKQWFTIEAWNEKADFVKKYLHTGRLVYVEGQLVNVSWRTKEGNTRNEIRIRLTHILFLDAPDPNVAGPSADEEEDPFLTEEDEFAFSDED
mgnify:CR=1 FL=1